MEHYELFFAYEFEFQIQLKYLFNYFYLDFNKKLNLFFKVESLIIIQLQNSPWRDNVCTLPNVSSHPLNSYQEVQLHGLG